MCYGTYVGSCGGVGGAVSGGGAAAAVVGGIVYVASRPLHSTSL